MILLYLLSPSIGENLGCFAILLIFVFGTAAILVVDTAETTGQGLVGFGLGFVAIVVFALASMDEYN